MCGSTSNGPLMCGISQLAHRFAHAVPVLFELGEALSPVVEAVGLGILLPLPVGEAALREDLGNDVRGPEVNLQVLVLLLPAHRLTRAPGPTVDITVQPKQWLSSRTYMEFKDSTLQCKLTLGLNEFR